jgi:MFS transporter, AAHS family, 4-hydroxybenzoate transporter
MDHQVALRAGRLLYSRRVFIIFIGNSTTSAWLLAAAAFGAAIVFAGQPDAYRRLGAGFGPTASRARGVSWESAVGQIGSLLGSMVGGTLIGLGYSMPTLFVIVAAPVILSVIWILTKSKSAPQAVHQSAVRVVPNLEPSSGTGGAVRA